MEKRNADRVIFNTTADIAYAGVSVHGTVTNLSLKGLFIEADQRIPSGTIVNVTIHLSGTEEDLHVAVAGTVNRSDERGTAIRFNEIDLDSYVHLKNIVRYSSPEGEDLASR